MRTIVVLPTYNERENLPRMLGALLSLTPCLRVIVVDDESPDGTGVIAEKYASRFSQVSAYRRSGKRGLGLAYEAGFRQALNDGADRIVTMDCDFSHDPMDLPRLLAVSDAADLVIGSRYVPGASVRNWPIKRKLLSAAANAYSRSVLGLTLRDCTSGFRVYRSSLLRKVLSEGIRSTGYSVQLELLTLAVHAFRAEVQEVPILFSERDCGVSKLDIREVTVGIGDLRRIRRRACDQKRAPRAEFSPELQSLRRTSFSMERIVESGRDPDALNGSRDAL